MSPERSGTGGPKALAPLGFCMLAVVVAAAWMQALVGFGRAVATPCPADGACLAPRLTQAAVDELVRNGFGPWGYVAAAMLLVSAGFLIPFGLGVLVAVRGAGSRRWAIGALWVTMAFGGITAYSDWPWARFTLVPLGVAGWFWLIALFPTMTLNPRWAAIPAAAASIWAAVTWGVPLVVEAIATQQAPWYQLVGPGFGACVAALLAAQVVRFRTSDAETRRALGQLLVGLSIVLGGSLVGTLLSLRPDIWGYGTVPGGLFVLLSSLGSLAAMVVIASAGLRDRVYGIRSAVDNVLVAGVLVVLVAGVHVAVVVVASLVFQDGPAVTASAVLATLAAAVAFVPIRQKIDRLVFGELNADQVLTAVTARVADAPTGDQVLTDAVNELCLRMRWPWARFVTADGVRSATGSATDETPAEFARTASVQLGHAGQLEVALRPGQRTLTRRDREILVAAAGPFSVAVSVARLTETAEAAQRETLMVRERERLSLRRRLHDGVGPSLAVARHLLQGVRQDLPATSAGQRPLASAEAAVADGLAQVRQISRELRPPGLDEAGFAQGLVATAADLGLVASVTSDGVGELPEHSRAQLYRIAVEAIVNAQRHGAAQAVQIVVEHRGTRLRMTVDDDGAGLPADAVPGVGIASMRERTAELGGRFLLAGRLPRGARVEVELPVAALADGLPTAEGRR